MPLQPPRFTFTRLNGPQLANTLGQLLVTPVDRIRDLATQLGMRPYNCAIIRTQWSGGARGHGVENVISTLYLEPTPKLVTMESLEEILNPVGLDENGQVQLIRVSGAYSEDHLRGLDSDGHGPEADQQWYYEIEFPRTDGKPSARRRFNLRGAPDYRAGKVGWTVKLEKAVENRQRNGDP